MKKIKKTENTEETLQPKRKKKKVRVLYWLSVFIVTVGLAVFIAGIGFCYYIVKSAPEFNLEEMFEKRIRNAVLTFLIVLFLSILAGKLAFIVIFLAVVLALLVFKRTHFIFRSHRICKYFITYIIKIRLIYYFHNT